MLDKIHSLLSMIEQEQGFYDLIKQNSTGITVKIGTRKSEFST